MQGFVDWRGNPISREKHGVRAARFIYFMAGASSMAYAPNSMNLVSYLHGTMHMDVASSSTLVTNFIGATCVFALLGAFLSDSYITRFKTMLMFAPFELLGFGLLSLHAHLRSLHPPECSFSGHSTDCEQAHGFSLTLLYMAMYSIALGEGIIRSCLSSFGGDQFDSDDPIESQLRSSFFNLYTIGYSLGGAIGLILIVWVENNKGWDYGFGASALVLLVGMLILASGCIFYRNQIPKGSPITRILQVLVAAFRKRNLNAPENLDELQLQDAKENVHDMEILSHTTGFKCLDKACIPHGDATAWSLCSVTQVEETKVVMGLIPIFLSTVICYIPYNSLTTFTVMQGNTMDTKLGKVHVSPVTLLVIPSVFQVVALAAYDRFFVPLARRVTGYSSGITQLQRIGVGFVAMILASCIAATVERKRLNVIERNELTDLHAVVPMSVIWLGGQFFILGITNSMAYVGLLEFFNSEVSRGMKSIGTAIFWCMFGLASILAGLLVRAANKTSRLGHRRAWLEGNNLNEGRLDLFYWLLSAVGFVGFLNYMYWSRRYVYRRNPRMAKL